LRPFITEISDAVISHDNVIKILKNNQKVLNDKQHTIINDVYLSYVREVREKYEQHHNKIVKYPKDVVPGIFFGLWGPLFIASYPDIIVIGLGFGTLSTFWSAILLRSALSKRDNQQRIDTLNEIEQELTAN